MFYCKRMQNESNLTFINFALATYRTMARTNKLFPRVDGKETIRHIHKLNIERYNPPWDV